MHAPALLPIDLSHFDGALPLDEPTPPAAGYRGIVYESDLVTIHHNRAENVLPSMTRESVDLVVTDPPYGVEWESGRRAESFGQLDGDGQDVASREMIRGIIEQATRIVGQHRHLYVFGPGDVLDGLKVSDVAELVWDKVALGSGDVTSSWSVNHERINFTVSKWRHGGKRGLPVLPTRMRRGSVLSFPRATGRQVRHPSEKPVPLIRELIESSSKQGETVLDPFAGTGSTGVAAVLSGRRAILIESDPRWIEVTVQRIKAAEKVHASMAGL